jgi:hypothetical protein
LLEIEKIIQSSGRNYNKHYLNRYINIINKVESIKFNGYVEKHHILPKSIFKEFKNNKDNIIIVSGRLHYILHWILAKVFGKGMWFAFNNMKRLGYKGILYEYSRIYISEEARKSHLGKFWNEEQKKKHSEKYKDSVVVRNKEGKNFRVSVFDQRYINGELLFVNTGRKNTRETIQKMKDNNGIRGKSSFINDEGNQIYLYIDEGLKLGYKRGFKEESLKKMKIGNLGRKFTDEHKKKIGEAQKGSKNHMFGKIPWNKGKKLK